MNVERSAVIRRTRSSQRLSRAGQRRAGPRRWSRRATGLDVEI